MCTDNRESRPLGSLILEILHREMTNMLFWESSWRNCSDLHDGSFSIQVKQCHVPSSPQLTPSIHLHQRCQQHHRSSSTSHDASTPPTMSSSSANKYLCCDLIYYFNMSAICIMLLPMLMVFGSSSITTANKDFPVGAKPTGKYKILIEK